MLPSILHIAERYKLISDPKTYGHKESRFKCPFCEQDSIPGNEKKFYLSLNTDDNVFKCWFCNESGGVLQFESILSNQPYEEIRKKYFGKRRKNLHPAYKLSPDQLREIGWQDKKRQSFQEFQTNRDEVIKDWNEYKYGELIKHYALFTLIAHFPIEKDKRDHYEWFVEICKESKVDNLAKQIVHEWNSNQKQSWSNEGVEVARIAYHVAHDCGDFNFLNLFATVLFIYELKTEYREEYSISI